MNPYILRTLPMQDLSGLQPVYQNIGQQQAMQQAALLRNKDPQSLGSKMGVYAKSIPAIMQYGSENVYGGFGQGQVPTMTTGEN